jgi:alkanesulfonate monooxygenase SsuD/methylene tetrahydromethanopterin reductase-like flavin-dependent oxidoreductase (luciferase family)
MTHALRFGALVLPNEDMPTLIRKAKNLEDCGFDIFAGADHFVGWSDTSRPWFEGWISLTAVALATTKLRIATYVSQIPLRHPAMFARQAQTLDHASNGRLEVGLGTGISIDPSYNMMGIENWDGKERVARFKEYVEIVDQLLSNETSSFDGAYYSIKDAVMRPLPLQSPRPPITIGALGPVMCRLRRRHLEHDELCRQLRKATGRSARESRHRR